MALERRSCGEFHFNAVLSQLLPRTVCKLMGCSLGMSTGSNGRRRGREGNLSNLEIRSATSNEFTFSVCYTNDFLDKKREIHLSDRSIKPANYLDHLAMLCDSSSHTSSVPQEPCPTPTSEVQRQLYLLLKDLPSLFVSPRLFHLCRHVSFHYIRLILFDTSLFFPQLLSRMH